MATVEPSRQVSQVAARVFESALVSWLVRKQDPDIHLDYVVETVEDGEPSGKTFAVQLKGGAPPRYCGQHVSQRVPVKHLTYYIDRVIDPVFLVVVDTQEQEGYYVFVQGLLKSQLKDNAWRRRKGKSIRVPLRQRLADTQRLQRDVDRAIAFMKELHPGSLEAAARSEREKLEQLDRRFRVDVEFKGGTPQFSMFPKEPVDLQMVALDRDAAATLFHAVATGEPVSFAPRSIHLSGSPLLERASAEVIAPIQFELSGKRECEISFAEADSEEVIRTIIPPFLAVLRKGRAVTTIEGELPRSPLRVKAHLPRLGATLPYSIGIEYEKWAGQDLLAAAHFERVKDLMEMIDGGRPVTMIVEFDGNPVTKARLNPGDCGELDSFLQVLGVLDAARIVARHFGLQPTVPRSAGLTQDAVKHIGIVRETIGKEGSVVVPVTSFSAQLDARDIEAFQSRLRSDGAITGPVRIAQEISVFDAKSESYCLVWEIDRARLTEESLRRFRDAGESRGLDITSRGRATIGFSVCRRDQLPQP